MNISVPTRVISVLALALNAAPVALVLFGCAAEVDPNPAVGSGDQATVAEDASGQSEVVAEPACLQRIRSECGLEGTCTSARPSPEVQLTCYASGARSAVTQMTACKDELNMTWSFEVRKPDGSLCYTGVSDCVCGEACERGTVTYFLPDGQQFYHREYRYRSFTYQCAGDDPVQCMGMHCNRPSANEPKCTFGTECQ